MQTYSHDTRTCGPHLGVAGGTLILQHLRLNSREWVRTGNGAFLFFFAQSGEAAWRCKSGTGRLASGDVLVLHTPAPATFAAASIGGATLAWFSVSDHQLNPLFDLGELCEWRAVEEAFTESRRYQSRSPLARTCHRLISEVPPSPMLAHRVHLLRIVSTVLCAELRAARHELLHVGDSGERILRTLGRLSITEVLRLSTTELCVRLSCSRRHLDRLFKGYFSLSVKGLRTELRLLKSAALLRNPHLKVINVADECGFNHLGRFNASFRQRFGRSPTEWRASQTHSPAAAETLSTLACQLRTIGLCPWTEAKSSAQKATDPVGG